MRRFSRLLLALVAVSTLAIAGCDSADSREADAVDRQQSVYEKTQPMPFFQWSLERHLLIKLYEARNKQVSTWSYVISPYTGRIIWWSPTLGYPIPGGTELTNPQSYDYHTGGGGVVLPQAEPNGTYAPGTSDGTWVMCVDQDGMVVPTYIEDHVLCSALPLKDVGGQLMPDIEKTASFRIDPSQGGN